MGGGGGINEVIEFGGERVGMREEAMTREGFDEVGCQIE